VVEGIGAQAQQDSNERAERPRQLHGHFT
jgi:hypothetical protein